MADISVIAVAPRTGTGTGAARATRRAGQVPAVIYGANKDPVTIAVPPRALDIEMQKPGFFARLFDLELDGRKQRVLCRDVQFHPVRDTPLHVDFLRVTATTVIAVDIPVRFVNEESSAGLKRGGVLNVVRHSIEVNCRADAIPAEFVIDLGGRDIGDSIHISSVDLPEGVTPTITDRDFTVATIAAPSGGATEADAEDGEDTAEADA